MHESSIKSNQRYKGTGGQERKEHNSVTRSTESTSVAIAVETISEASVAYISITLLKTVTMELHLPGGIICAIPLDLNPKTLQLLAYLGWKRSAGVRRDLLLEQIWGHGRTDEEATSQRLGEAFNNAKKSLRSTVRKVAKKLNTELGEIMLSPTLDIFEHRYQMWRLSSICRVSDLEIAEAQYQVIAEAKKRGALANAVPEYVKEACDALIAAYNGDYLEILIQLYPYDLEPLVNNWAREPFTFYRDCYLQALWYAAEYELQAGHRFTKVSTSVELRQKQRESWARAAELYRIYAMHACNNRFDAKIYFGLPNRGDGERVRRSEQALRNCVMLYGELGSSYLIDETYYAYYDLMRNISDENWDPSEEIQRAVQAARSRAATYQTKV
jgi:hypothetical protein